MINYEYKDTENKEIKPEGEGWKYAGKRIVKNKEGEEIVNVAVWKRDADIYKDEKVQQ